MGRDRAEGREEIIKTLQVTGNKNPHQDGGSGTAGEERDPARMKGRPPSTGKGGCEGQQSRGPFPQRSPGKRNTSRSGAGNKFHFRRKECKVQMRLSKAVVGKTVRNDKQKHSKGRNTDSIANN